jgi:phenylalanyl-tRNA synthetase beta chain
MTLGLQPAAIAERDRELGFEIPAPVEIVNPLSDDQRYLRYAMLHAHLAMIARDRLRPCRTFELGHVFSAGNPDPAERNIATVVAATAHVDEPAWRSTPFAQFAADVLAAVRALTGLPAELERATALHLHPGKTAAIVVGGTRVGVVGVVDPRLLHAYEIDDDVVVAVLEIEALPAHTIRPFTAPSRFPAIERDLAIVLPAETPAGDVLRAIRAHPDVRSAEAFDEYRGAQIDVAKKSLAVRVAFQRDDATLTDAIAEAAVSAIVADLRTRFGATLRG